MTGLQPQTRVPPSDWLPEVKHGVGAAYDRAFRLALQTVKRLVNDHMEAHPDIQTFCMGMGGWSYYLFKGVKRVDEDGEEWDLSDKKVGGMDCDRAGGLLCEWEHPELEEFIDEWDIYLRLTGSPWRVDRVGDKLAGTTDW